MSQKDWYVLNRESQLLRLKKLLEEIPLIEMSGESIYVRLGYKILTPADKETYYFMRDLTLFSRYKFGSDGINPSLDYVAICLGTTAKTQTNRIKKLEECELLTKTRRKYKTNIYLINTQPLPDSTFVSTLVTLIRRKKIIQLLEKYNKTEDTFEKNSIINQLYLLNNNPFYKDVIKEIQKHIE